MNQLKEMLEAYRNGERGLPTYDELQSIVEAGEQEQPEKVDRKTINYREFSELAVKFKTADIGSAIAYCDLVEFIDGKLNGDSK